MIKLITRICLFLGLILCASNIRAQEFLPDSSQIKQFGIKKVTQFFTPNNRGEYSYDIDGKLIRSENFRNDTSIIKATYFYKNNLLRKRIYNVYDTTIHSVQQRYYYNKNKELRRQKSYNYFYRRKELKANWCIGPVVIYDHDLFYSESTKRKLKRYKRFNKKKKIGQEKVADSKWKYIWHSDYMLDKIPIGDQAESRSSHSFLYNHDTTLKLSVESMTDFVDSTEFVYDHDKHLVLTIKKMCELKDSNDNVIQTTIFEKGRRIRIVEQYKDRYSGKLVETVSEEQTHTYYDNGLLKESSLRNYPSKVNWTCTYFYEFYK